MKIKNRLIVAFLIITLIPLFGVTICFHQINHRQTEMLKESYSTDPGCYDDYGFILNPIQLLYSLTLNDFNTLTETSCKTPDKFIDNDYLHDISKDLRKHYSFIVVKRNNTEYFIGNSLFYKRLSPLPNFNSKNTGNNKIISLDQNTAALIREKDFFFSDSSQGQIFLVTDLSKLIPRWKSYFMEIMSAVIIILIVTAIILIMWLHHSIIKPLSILRLATKQIGAGNLDEPIHVSSSDEIGELCRDFEEMRIRLKSILEERIKYEEDTREMMSSISHDLKTPLTTIKGYSEGLIDGVANTPEKREKYLRTIIAKTVDMTYLVDELSIFSKIEQNALPYNFVTLNIDEYFSDSLDDLTLELEAQNIDIKYINHTAKGTNITADPEQLKRVINNIVGNTAKYMDKENGHLKIEITDLKPKKTTPLYRQINKDGTDLHPAVKEDEYIQIEISDNGPGIQEEALPFIFDKFYRTDSSRNSSKGGSGLGLAIVKKIIRDHGGEIWAKSTPGKGTSIFFTLKKEEM